MTTVASRYVIERKLASGGMADVYLAHVQGVAGFTKPVVLKRILPELASEPELLAMFIDEAKVVARLSHPNIVQVHELGCDSGNYYIVMEYVAGASLADILRASPGGLSVPTTLSIAAALLSGLHYAHEFVDASGRHLGIVHRDVSPHNLLIGVDGLVKVADFGVARFEGRLMGTRSGVFKGKYAYMSPEQARGATIDRRSDVFSAGLLIIEALTGERVYQASDDLMLLEVAREGRVPSLVAQLPSAPPALTEALVRATKREPSERFATCQAFARALSNIAPLLDEAGLSAILSDKALPAATEVLDVEPRTVVTLTAALAPARRMSRRWAAAAAALAVAGVLLALQTLKPRAPIPAPEPVLAVAPPPPVPDEPPSRPRLPVTPSGFLTVSARPWSYVFVDGVQLPKTTPIIRYPVRAGSHRLRIESPGLGVARELSVNVSAGSESRSFVDFTIGEK